jgi:Tfp pilus assembly protein PilO
MNKLSKDKQQQLIAVAMASVVVIGLLYFFVISAQGKSKAGKKAEIETAQASVDEALKLKKDTPAIQEQLDEVTARQEAMEKNMAAGDLYSWVILTVNDFKSKGGYRVQIPNFSREERVGIGMYGDFPYDAVKYQLKGNGYYHDLGKFLADFENAFPFIRVQNLDILPEGGVSTGAEAEKLSFRFEIVVPLKPKE